MKKYLLIFICLLSSICLTACDNKNAEIELEEVKKVANLAVFEVEYNNVVKTTVKKGTGLDALFEKDRKYWIEYTGVAKIGIDTEKLEVKVKDDKVRVYIPSPTILMMDMDDDKITSDNVISSADSILNSNPITPEIQSSALDKGQENMKKTILQNKTLLESAQKRSKVLIENYINNISDITGVEYKITWDLEEIKIEKDTK